MIFWSAKFIESLNKHPVMDMFGGELSELTEIPDIQNLVSYLIKCATAKSEALSKCCLAIIVGNYPSY